MVLIHWGRPVDFDECSLPFTGDGFNRSANIFNTILHNTESQMTRADVIRVKAESIIPYSQVNMALITVITNLDVAG